MPWKGREPVAWLSVPARSSQSSESTTSASATSGSASFARYASGRRGVQPMVGRERGGGLDVREHRRVELLGERDARVPAFEAARAAAGEDHGLLCVREELRGRGDQLRRRLHRRGRRVARHVRQRRHRADLRFLHRDVEVDVDGAARRGLRDLRGAQHGFARRGRRSGLVVPLGEAADESALVGARVYPVDPLPAPRRVPRSRRAEHEDRRAVAPRVVDRHRRAQQPDVRVHGGGHHAIARFGIAVRDRDRGLFVHRHDHLGRAVAEIVDEAVVKSAIARAGHERDVRNAELAHDRRDVIARPDRFAGP